MRILLLFIALLLSAPVSAVTLGSLAFTDCELAQPGTGATTRAQCARLEVPENPDQPEGRKISLKVAMVAATAAQALPDPVIFLAGGPGQSATESYPGMAAAFSRLRAKRDLVFMDQRGTGGSRPLACGMPEELAEALAPDPALLEKMARDCLAELSKDADVSQDTTSVAVRDIEALRLAIGAPRLNLYGASYGTRVAQEYARAYPDAVRSLILDGVVPPDLALGSEHAINLEDALTRILGQCASQPGCSEAFGDPYRTLYALRDAARSAPTPVAARDPLTHAPRPMRLDEGAVALIARLFAYGPETAALLPLLLHEAYQGRPESLVSQAAQVFDSLSSQINHGMQLSVICAEDAPRLSPREQDKNLILGDAIVGITLSQCTVWPKGPVSDGFHQLLRTDTPTLLLSGEFDPVTPPRYAEHVLASLGNARHLVGRGQGHILLQRGCTARLAAQFLDALEPASLKSLDASCLDALGSTPFFINHNGAQP
jgi:pimeloyl-ACP methyl ester carboxylesterase